MHDFDYHSGELCAERLPLSAIAQQYGTPTFVYSRHALESVYRQYADALAQYPGLICYAVKANSNLAVLNVLARLGSGFDIVSGGELERVLAAGGSADKIIFSGVGKTVAEMRRALEVGIACFNIESLVEIDRLADVAADMGCVAPISLRINPDVDAQTHPYISTGLKSNKFGIDIGTAEEAYCYASTRPSLRIRGIDCHIGSQLSTVQPLVEACERLLDLYDRLTASGIHVEHLDLGGGLGVTYRDEKTPAIDTYIKTVIQLIGKRPLQLMFEPGRSIAGNAGILLTRVEYLKTTPYKNFAVVDAAMNDLIRPALYKAWHDIVPVQKNSAAATQQWDIVGPICESSDFIGHERSLALSVGDLIAVKSAGAYGFVMSSNYNSRPRAAEVMVDGEQCYIVRQRESLTDLWRGESTLPS